MPDRIMRLVEWELKKKEEAEEMEKKRAEKEAKKKERALNAKLKEDEKALKAQVNIVAFLNAIGGFLPPDFDGTKALVSKSVMVKFFCSAPRREEMEGMACISAENPYTCE